MHKWQSVLSPLEVAYSEKNTVAFRNYFGYHDEAQETFSALDFLRIAMSYPIHVVGAMLINPRRVAIQIRAMFGGFGRRDGKTVAD